MISLAMIVKNEERRIARAIRSAGKCVGEVVVVDTGSTDRTREIAAELGAVVLDHPFTGDFSEARNVSLAACTGDWVLVLDADEFFPMPPGLMIETAVGETLGDLPNDYKGYYFLRHNFEDSTMAVTYSDFVLRLFRNVPGVEYRHRVHESVEESLDCICGKYGKLTSIPLSHYLIDRDAEYIQRKRKLYLDGLLRDISENPGDASRYDFLGCEYARAGNFEAASRAFEKLLELEPNHPTAREALADVLKLLGKDEAA